MTAEFLLFTTFSNELGGGNPAAVVFTDIAQPTDFATIARYLNQPITAFVSASQLPCVNPKTVAFNVCWFTASGNDLPLCGHGAIAAARAIFERDGVGEDVEVVEFRTLSHSILSARKCKGGLIEIELPSTNTTEVCYGEYMRLSKLFAHACGRELAIQYIGTGGEGFENYAIQDVLIVLAVEEDLKGLQINAAPLRESGYFIHVFSTDATSGKERFYSRMFAPGIVPGDEDHVCGSAHCLMVPYWYKRLNISSGQEIWAKQVSSRGGILNLVWEAEKKTIRLRGEVVLLGKGELRLRTA